jgi:formylglycine-generating enzyme required for sulfatase activity
MTRLWLIGSVALGTALAGAALGALATGIEHAGAAKATVGSCAAYSGLPAGQGVTAGMVPIRGGRFLMGSERHQPEERFAHPVQVDGFWIDSHEVTNAQFRTFVEATGYLTLAERGIDPKARPDMAKDLLVPGSVVFIQPTDVRRGGRITQWWQYVAGANWRAPAGPGSSIAGKDNHPVVHVAYEDAQAYARWRGGDLPTEAQWEFAARGGRDGEDDWSSAFNAEGKPIANTWQGVFPVINSQDDGYAGAAPVGCFRPNGYGLYDMIGNVWEWTTDWYEPRHPADAIKACCVPLNPRGGREEASYDLNQPEIKIPRKVLKGGSHLCAPNYCRRYRPAARFPEPVDTSACHVGFRCIVRPGGGST